MTEHEIHELCATIRQTSLAAHAYLRHGHNEKVYENSLRNRLRRRGLLVLQQHPMVVRDEDDSVLGEFFADLLVQGELLIELKAVRQLTDDHTSQVLGYLRASRLKHALLINFGSPKIQFKKFIFDPDFVPAS